MLNPHFLTFIAYSREKFDRNLEDLGRIHSDSPFCLLTGGGIQTKEPKESPGEGLKGSV